VVSPIVGGCDPKRSRRSRNAGRKEVIECFCSRESVALSFTGYTERVLEAPQGAL
jgi:hypothetical protein